MDKSCIPCFFTLLFNALLCCIRSRVVLAGQAYCPRGGGLILFPIGLAGLCMSKTVLCLSFDVFYAIGVGINSLEAR